eukprot:scaffold14053_cov102-Isochrysis_galbana.AAC.2
MEGDRGASGVRALEGGSPQISARTPTPLSQPRCRPIELALFCAFNTNTLSLRAHAHARRTAVPHPPASCWFACGVVVVAPLLLHVHAMCGPSVRRPLASCPRPRRSPTRRAATHSHHHPPLPAQSRLPIRSARAAAPAPHERDPLDSHRRRPSVSAAPQQR